MADPKRLIEEIGSGFERDLLRLGSSERAPDGARERLALSLFGVAVVAPLVFPSKAAAAAGGVGSAGSGSALGAALKWLGIGAVAGALSTAAGVALERRLDDSKRIAAPNPDSTRVNEHAAPPSADEVGAPERIAGPVGAAQTRAAPEARPADRKAPRGAVWIGSPATTLESQSIARIRTLAERDPKRALELLDEHDARFPRQLATQDTRALRERIREKRAPERRF